MSAGRIWASSAVAGPLLLPALLIFALDDRRAERTLQYLKTGISQSAYRRIDLPVVDTIWENIPESDRHVFRDPDNRPSITVYEKARP